MDTDNEPKTNARAWAVQQDVTKALLRETQRWRPEFRSCGSLVAQVDECGDCILWPADEKVRSRMYAEQAAQLGRWLVATFGAVALAFISATPAAAYTDADYCRDTARADRQACHAQHLDDLAICLDTYAFGRWIGDEDAGQTVVECRADADAACRDCKADVPACEVQP